MDCDGHFPRQTDGTVPDMRFVVCSVYTPIVRQSTTEGEQQTKVNGDISILRWYDARVISCSPTVGVGISG